MITHLCYNPKITIGQLLETQKHDIGDILREAHDAEQAGLQLYLDLLDLVKDKSVYLEEYARKMIYQEEAHVDEVNKMLRKPGEIAKFDN
jgi:bacterioferritin